MKDPKTIIDIFVTIIDNYGDMGFACEFVSALFSEYGDQYECIIWADDVVAMREFVSRSWIGEVETGDISDFWLMRKSAIGVSILHAPIPDLDCFALRALILRVDYLSLDPNWISQNGTEHIISTRDRQIIELIPSPLEGGAWLIPIISSSRWDTWEKHITIFAYSSTLERIDWDSFPSDLIIYVFADSEDIKSQKSNIRFLDFLPTHDFYVLLDTSEFAIIRWEVSWAHMIQGSTPFFWDMYQTIGGWPIEQSEQFQGLIWASPEYHRVHQILGGQKSWKISYADMLLALSHTRFAPHRTHNLIHTAKKHIDRFHNSI